MCCGKEEVTMFDVLCNKFQHGITHMLTEYHETFTTTTPQNIYNTAALHIGANSSHGSSVRSDIGELCAGVGVVFSYVLQMVSLAFLGYWLVVALTTVCALWMTLNGSMFQDITVVHTQTHIHGAVFVQNRSSVDSSLHVHRKERHLL